MPGYRTFRAHVWLILTLLIVGGTTVVILTRVLAQPEDSGRVGTDPQAGLRVQSVLAQILLREAGLSAHQEPLVLAADEVNAFLAGHVQVRDSPVWPVRVRIYPTEVELGGSSTLGRLIEAGAAQPVAWLLPRSLADRPVWITTGGTVAVTSGGRAEFVPHRAAIGRQGLPLALFWSVVGGQPRTLVWRMPRVVERVEIEPGRLVIHTRRPGTDRAAPG